MDPYSNFKDARGALWLVMQDLMSVHQAFVSATRAGGEDYASKLRKSTGSALGVIVSKEYQIEDMIFDQGGYFLPTDTAHLLALATQLKLGVQRLEGRPKDSPLREALRTVTSELRAYESRRDHDPSESVQRGAEAHTRLYLERALLLVQRFETFYTKHTEILVTLPFEKINEHRLAMHGGWGERMGPLVRCFVEGFATDQGSGLEKYANGMYDRMLQQISDDGAASPRHPGPTRPGRPLLGPPAPGRPLLGPSAPGRPLPRTRKMPRTRIHFATKLSPSET